MDSLLFFILISFVSALSNIHWILYHHVIRLSVSIGHREMGSASLIPVSWLAFKVLISCEHSAMNLGIAGNGEKLSCKTVAEGWASKTPRFQRRHSRNIGRPRSKLWFWDERSEVSLWPCRYNRFRRWPDASLSTYPQTQRNCRR